MVDGCSWALYTAEVTIPNLFKPPLRAKNRSGCEESTDVMVPFGRTRLKLFTVSHVKPKC